MAEQNADLSPLRLPDIQRVANAMMTVGMEWATARHAASIAISVIEMSRCPCICCTTAIEMIDHRREGWAEWCSCSDHPEQERCDVGCRHCFTILTRGIPLRNLIEDSNDGSVR